jgi:hypothetical protein
VTREGPNGRCSKDLTPKPKPRPLGAKRGLKNTQNNLESHLEGKPDKLNNACDVKPCHVENIKVHNRNMECHEEPHPYPQGITKH